MSSKRSALIAGVDEAGRGPLAGPVVAAAVILDSRSKIPLPGLLDSKVLSAERRETLYIQIVDNCIAYAVGQASVAEIDTINILQATLLAMQRAVLQLHPCPTEVLIDGRDKPNLQLPMRAIIGGDGCVAAISAASIIAKVTRDRMMQAYEQQYPGYGFAAHKGYGTREHMAKLQHLGACAIHRRSFAPVQQVLLREKEVL